jgi:ArsR family transcriptional regulator, arsenate/arsenite/antimonite-responsive transcriptional repressor / arsenate reductase (thioredoxin)
MNLDQVSQAAADRDRRARVLNALGDPLRLGVVDLLQGQDVSPDALASALQVPGNLLAHHLKVLEGAGVITRSHSQNDRRRTYVHLVDASLDGLLQPPASIEAPRVVFVCTHNSARSVLAQALWRSVSDVPSASAGTQPAARINPRARSAARRAGLTLQDAPPRRIDDVVLPDDVVVSVCDAVNEELGTLPNRRIHWSVPDPSRLDTDVAFATAVADLNDRVSHLAPRIRYRRHTPHRKAPR